MVDVHTPDVRRRNMAAIKSRDTKPEILIRKSLHHQGFRYRLHAKDLPGKPDLVFPRYKAVLFINGCFWHQHNCHLFKWPQTRLEFWRDKISGNVTNDQKKLKMLEDQGWRVGIIWECALKGKRRINHDAAMQMLTEWLNSGVGKMEVQGLAE